MFALPVLIITAITTVLTLNINEVKPYLLSLKDSVQNQEIALSQTPRNDENIEVTPTPTPELTPTATPTPTKAPTPTPKPTMAPVIQNTPPGAGYQRISVQGDSGVFTVDVVVADLSSTKVIVDTASTSDCNDNCPVLSLGDYVGRNGAFAGLNGSFFCPSTYPSCAGKTNSFDTLIMNKNKTYFNSDNNVYSTVPAVIFSPGSIRFVSQTLEWGRDTGIDSMIANYPLYLLGGNNVYGGSNDSKITAKGARTFVGGGSGKVYIGVVSNASASDMPSILKKMGIQDALGMDQGGSTALWANGRYVFGPGRGLPSAILFVRR